MDEWDPTTEYEPISSIAPSPDRSAWVQHMVGRLEGVRIHDTAQAGELARRLGARAFTIGRDVYVRPDLLRPATAQSMALLAHELYHVSEQTGASHSGLDMPLLRPANAPTMPAASPHASMPVQRAAGSETPAPASLSGSELAAEAIESAVVRHQVAEMAAGRSGGEPPNPQDIADKVYSLIVQDLMLDKERAAHGW